MIWKPLKTGGITSSREHSEMELSEHPTLLQVSYRLGPATGIILQMKSPRQSQTGRKLHSWLNKAIHSRNHAINYLGVLPE